ncbi:DUF58 domain-containing protein [Planomicrobium okeanokoites]|uniref:DUF58 domain-containing protein n=1 Tax=Planomicrobium okeanokoites TaxID=244 RepID=A0ABV7KNT3_PLAOK|nr:DUF58 domain-containing protein [Planomicrobium okeanokoites]TAA71562.1 DUF58 domain-containing protein [Planomicrobium okeanokoites]
MTWIRHDYGIKNTKWAFGFIIVLFFMSMVFLQFTAAAITAFIGFIVALQLAYFSKLGDKLIFNNPKIRKRVLNGGDSNWELSFENKGLPIWGGNLKIWFIDTVVPAGQEAGSYTELVELDIPFTAGHKESVVLKVPVTGKRRGLSRIKKMELSIPHPFGQGSLMLEYGGMILQEQLVYPKLRKYQFRYAPSKQKPGQFNLKHSLFEDLFQPIGTRDYVPTDQFNQIHWKASARMQTYQTKVYNHVANEAMLFVLNVADRYAAISNLEERIEELASYIENCFSEGVPYAIAINVRSAGKIPFLYLAPGEGGRQRQHALELLSVISKNNSTMPFASMIAHLDLHTELPYTTYLMTDNVESIRKYIPKWSRKTELKILRTSEGRVIA